MSDTTWVRFELAGRTREQFREFLELISEEFRGGFIRNYMGAEVQFVAGELDAADFLENVRYMQADIRAVESAEKGK